jgi:hypothetical protein
VCSSKKRQFPHSHSNPASRSNSSFLSRVCTCTLHRADMDAVPDWAFSNPLVSTQPQPSIIPAPPYRLPQSGDARVRFTQIHTRAPFLILPPIQSNPIQSIPFHSYLHNHCVSVRTRDIHVQALRRLFVLSLSTQRTPIQPPATSGLNPPVLPLSTA